MDATIISKAFKDNKFYNLINETTKKMLKSVNIFHLQTIKNI